MISILVAVVTGVFSLTGIWLTAWIAARARSENRDQHENNTKLITQRLDAHDTRIHNVEVVTARIEGKVDTVIDVVSSRDPL